MKNVTVAAQVMDDISSNLPETNQIGLLENTFFNKDLFDESNWFMPLLQLGIAIVFSILIVASSVSFDRCMRSKVRRLEKERFVQRGDVTGEYGRSTYGRAFEKMVWSCTKRRSTAERVGIIEKRGTLCDWLKATCRDFRTKAYWKMKFEELLEISRAEHTILGIIWPVDDELVYFTRAQRLFCYYCGMVDTLLVIEVCGRSYPHLYKLMTL